MLSNSEFRNTLWQQNYAILQAVAFVDLVSVSEDAQNLDTLDGASAGLGLRVIFPNIYRFVLRLDVAEPLKKNDDERISLGVQQFF